MWSTRCEQLTDARGLKIFLDRASLPVSFSEALNAWQNDAAFRSYFFALLAESPYSAFRWETPPVTDASVNRPFEFVLLDSPGLARTPDPGTFADHLDAATPGEEVVSFPNLGHDAVLIVPCPVGPFSAYGHLAAFVREAPEPQKHLLWSHVGAIMKENLGPTPIWLSTAGAGVSWLHVRIDRRPKYYGYGPYRAYP